MPRKTKLKINNKCRTCPRTDNFLGISVNGFSETHEEPIYLMLVYCTQMQFSPNDALPQRVCPDCLASLDSAYAFWKQCRQRDAYLRDLVLGLLPASVETNRPVPEIPTISPEPVVTAALPVPQIVATAAETTLATPQSFWCCFRKCPTVTTSLADMEQHAERDHFADRVANEVQRAPNREHVCSVCCAGYASLGSLEYHRMIQLGIRPKFGVSAGETTEEPQGEEEEVEPKQQESAMDFEVSDAADENATNSTMPFEIVPIKEESYISDEQDESVQDALKCEAEKFDCPHCGVEILSDEEKQRHLVCECPILHHQEGSSKVQSLSKQCPRCRRPFNTSDGLERHISLCTADKPDAKLTCPNCGSVFNAKANLSRHLKIGACLRDPYQCKYCFEKLPDIKSLNRHCKVECRAMLNTEPNGIKLKCHCEHCGKGFRTKALLRRHQIVDGCGAEDRMAKTVKDPKKIQCPYCFEHFILKNLKRHLQQHCLVLLEKQVEAKRAAAALAQDATSGTR
uniref:Zinc finger protein PLAGL2 n=1 Tax=Culex pipiens TaxID=7175 RepID=A0A8D8N0L8_CULPI